MYILDSYLHSRVLLWADACILTHTHTSYRLKTLYWLGYLRSHQPSAGQSSPSQSAPGAWRQHPAAPGHDPTSIERDRKHTMNWNLLLTFHCEKKKKGGMDRRLGRITLNKWSLNHVLASLVLPDSSVIKVTGEAASARERERTRLNRILCHIVERIEARCWGLLTQRNPFFPK